MKFEKHIFKSTPANNENFGPHFLKQEAIQSSLEEICNAWATHLRSHIEQTKNLPKGSMLPWEDNERAIVSTLSAAIIRKFPQSLVLEECRVKKPGRNSKQESGKSSDSGRCDLWAFIPELKVASKPVSFYLEAKRSRTSKTTNNLQDYLRTDRGISRLFNDYLKSNPGKIRKLSPYHNLNDREHPHYVIGMLVMPFERCSNDPKGDDLYAKFDGILRDVFEKGHAIKVKGNGEGTESERHRRLGRFPTVALIFGSQDDRNGMIATFTVFGATRDLLTKRND